AAGVSAGGLLFAPTAAGGKASGAVPIRIAGPAGGEASSRAAPQWGQKAKSASHAAPHARQAVGCLRPHCGQKAKPGESSKPHPAHAIVIDDQTSDSLTIAYAA